ncbi:MAG: fructosamine kinase family protein [Ectothiorhodospiraceae bacterium]|jgi:fructosamine-3-kinase
MDLIAGIAAHIESATGQRVDAAGASGVGGGSISRAFRLGAGDGAYFVKTNAGDGADAMFQAEAEGLRLLDQANALRVPRPVCSGVHGAHAYLVLEHIEFGRPGVDGGRRMGEGLAVVHGCLAERFGWERDNTIGSTPQINTPDDDWVRFFRHRRLGYQLELARGNGYARQLSEPGERLLELLDVFFTDYRPRPSLLHGDLWGGNAAFDTAGRPVIFDPAVYYGDRETDLAMTELFGGFPAGFHEAYQAAWPLDPGYAVRRDLYQLYHVLNHVNLFGGGYLAGARRLIDRLLAHAR